MKDYSRYLIDEPPITFHPSLAVALGVNEAILLQKINLWLNCKPSDGDGSKWIYNSYKNWQQQLPFLSEITIKRAMSHLMELGIVKKSNFNKLPFDKTNWYTIDYDVLDELVVSKCTIDSIKMTPREYQNDTISSYQNDTTNTNESKESNNDIVKTTKKKTKTTPKSVANRKPTLEEVTDYIEEKELNVDPEAFFNYYEAGDWVDQNGKEVKNWKLKVQLWNSKSTSVVNKKPKYTMNDISIS